MNHTQHVNEHKAIQPNGFTGVIAANSNLTIEKSFQKKGTSIVNAFDNANVVLQDCATPGGVVASTSETVATRVNALKNEKDENLLPMWVHYVLKRYTHDQISNYQDIDKAGTGAGVIKPINYDVNDADYNASDAEDPNTIVSGYRADIFKQSTSNNPQVSWSKDGTIKYVNSDYSLETRIAANRGISTDEIDFTSKGYYLLFGVESSIRAVWPLDKIHEDKQDSPNLNLHLFDRIVYPMKSDDGIYIKYSDDIYEYDSYGNKIEVEGTKTLKYSPKTHKKIANTISYRPALYYSNGYKNIKLVDYSITTDPYYSAKMYLQFHVSADDAISSLFFMGPYDNSENTVCYQYEVNNALVTKNDIEPTNFYFKFNGVTYNLYDAVNGAYENIPSKLSTILNSRLMLKNGNVVVNEENAALLSGAYFDKSEFYFSIDIKKVEGNEFVDRNSNSITWIAGLANKANSEIAYKTTNDTNNKLCFSDGTIDYTIIPGVKEERNLNPYTDELDKNLHFFTMKSSDGNNIEDVIHFKPVSDSIDQNYVDETFKPIIISKEYKNDDGSIDFEKFANDQFNARDSIDDIGTSKSMFIVDQKMSYTPTITTCISTVELTMPNVDVEFEYEISYTKLKENISATWAEDEANIRYSDINVTIPAGSIKKTGEGKKYGLMYQTQLLTYRGYIAGKNSSYAFKAPLSTINIKDASISDFVDKTGYNNNVFNETANADTIINKSIPGPSFIKPDLNKDISSESIEESYDNDVNTTLGKLLQDYTSPSSTTSISTKYFDFDETTAKCTGYKDDKKDDVENTLSDNAISKISYVNDTDSTFKQRVITENGIKFNKFSETTGEMYGLALFKNYINSMSKVNVFKVKPEGFVHIEFDENDLDAYCTFLGQDQGTQLEINKERFYQISKTLRKILITMNTNYGYDVLVCDGDSINSSNYNENTSFSEKGTATFDNIGWVFASCIYTLGIDSSSGNGKNVYIKSIDFIDKKYAEKFEVDVSTHQISSYSISLNNTSDIDELKETSYSNLDFSYEHHKFVDDNEMNTINDSSNKFALSSLFNCDIASKCYASSISIPKVSATINDDSIQLGFITKDDLTLKFDNDITNITGQSFEFNNYFTSKLTFTDEDNEDSAYASGKLSAIYKQNNQSRKTITYSISGDLDIINYSEIFSHYNDNDNEFNEYLTGQLFKYENIGATSGNYLGNIMLASTYNKLSNNYLLNDIFRYNTNYKTNIDDKGNTKLEDALSECGFYWDDETKSWKCSLIEDEDVKYSIDVDNITASLDENRLADIISVPLIYDVKPITYADISGDLLSIMNGGNAADEKTFDDLAKEKIANVLLDYINANITTTDLISGGESKVVNAMSGVNSDLIAFKEEFFTVIKESGEYKVLTDIKQTSNDYIIKVTNNNNEIIEDIKTNTTYDPEQVEITATSGGTMTYEQLALDDINTYDKLSCTVNVKISLPLSSDKSVTSSYIYKLNSAANILDASQTSASFVMGLSGINLSTYIVQNSCDRYIIKDANDIVGILSGVGVISGEYESDTDEAFKMFMDDKAAKLAEALSGNLWKNEDGENIIPNTDLFSEVSANLTVVRDQTKERGYYYRITNAWEPTTNYFNGHMLTNENAGEEHIARLFWANGANIVSVDYDMYAGEENFLYLYWDKSLTRPIFTDGYGYILKTSYDGKKIDSDSSSDKADANGAYYKHLQDYDWAYECEYEKANFNDWYDAEAYVNYSSLNNGIGLEYGAIIESDYVTYEDKYVTLLDHNEIIKKPINKNIDELRKYSAPIVLTSNCEDTLVTVIDNNSVLKADSQFESYSLNNNFATLFTGVDTDDFVREQSYKAFSFNFKIPKEGWTKLAEDQYSLNTNYGRILTGGSDIYPLQTGEGGIFAQSGNVSAFIKAFDGHLLVKANVLREVEDSVFRSFNANDNAFKPMSSYYGYDIYDISWTAVLRKEQYKNGSADIIKYAFTLFSNNDTISFSDTLETNNDKYSVTHELRNVVIPTVVNNKDYTIVISNLYVKVIYDNNTLRLSIIDANGNTTTDSLSTYTYYYDSKIKDFDWSKSVNSSLIIRNSATNGMLNTLYSTTSNEFKKFKFTNNEWNNVLNYAERLYNAVSGASEVNYDQFNYYSTLLLENYGVSSELIDDNGSASNYKVTIWSMTSGVNKVLQNVPLDGNFDQNNLKIANMYGGLYANLVDGVPVNDIIDLPEVLVRPGEFIFTSNENCDNVKDFFEDELDKSNATFDMIENTTIRCNNDSHAIIYDNERYNMPYDATIPLFLYKSGANDSTINSKSEVVMINARKMYEAPTYADTKPNDGSFDLNLNSLYDKEIELTAMIDLSYYAEGESPFKEVIPYVDKEFKYSYLYADANNDEINMFNALNRKQVRYTNFKPKTPLYRLYKLNADVDFYSTDNVECKLDTPSNNLSSIYDPNNGINVPFKLKMSFNNLMFQEKIREGAKYDNIDNVTETDRLFDIDSLSAYDTTVISSDTLENGKWGMSSMINDTTHRFYVGGNYLNCDTYRFNRSSELTGQQNFIGGDNYNNDILLMTTMKDTVSDWDTEYTTTKYGKFDIYTDYNPTTTNAFANGRCCVGTPYFNVLEKKMYVKTTGTGTAAGDNGNSIDSSSLAAVMKIATDKKYIANFSNVKSVGLNTTITDIFDSAYIKQGDESTCAIDNIVDYKDYIVATCTLNSITITDYRKTGYIEFKYNNDNADFSFMVKLDGLLYEKNAVVVANNSKTYKIDNVEYKLYSVKSSDINLYRNESANPYSATLYGTVDLYFVKNDNNSMIDDEIEIHNVKMPAPTIKSMTLLNPDGYELTNGAFFIDDNRWRAKVILNEKTPNVIEKNKVTYNVINGNFFTHNNIKEDLYFSLNESCMLGGSVKERYDVDGKLTGLLLTLKMSGLKKFDKSNKAYIMTNPVDVKLTDNDMLTGYQNLNAIATSANVELKGYISGAQIGDTVQSGLLQMQYNYVDTKPIDMKLHNVGSYQYTYNPVDNDLFQLEVVSKNKNNDYKKNIFYVNMPVDKWYNMTISRETKYPDDYNETDLGKTENADEIKNISLLHFYLTDIDGETIEDITSTSREVFDVSTLNSKIIDGERAGTNSSYAVVEGVIKAGLWNYDIGEDISFDPCSRKAFALRKDTDKALAGAKLGIKNDENNYGKAGRTDLIKISDEDVLTSIDFKDKVGTITLFAGNSLTSKFDNYDNYIISNYSPSIATDDSGNTLKECIIGYAPRRVMFNDDDNYFVLRKKDLKHSVVSIPGMQCKGIMWISTPNLDSGASKSTVKPYAVSYTDSIADSYKLVNEYSEFFKNCQHKLPAVDYVNKILDSDYAELIFNNCRNMKATANASAVDNTADDNQKIYTYENTPLTISYVWDNAKVSRTENAVGKNALAENTLLSWNKNLYNEYIAEIGSIYNFQDSESVVNMTISEIGQHKDRQIIVLPAPTTNPFTYTKLSDETGLVSIAGKDPIVATAALGYNGSGYPKNSVMYYNGNDSIKIDTTQTTYLYIKQTDSTTDCKFGATQEKPVYVDTVSENTCSYSERYEFIPSPYVTSSNKEFTTDKLNTLIYGNAKKLNDNKILSIIEASNEMSLSALESLNNKLVANNFYTAITKTLKNFTEFNEYDSSIIEYSDTYSSDTDVKNFTFVTNLLGQHYKTDESKIAVLQTVDYNVFNTDKDEDDSMDEIFWQTMNCFYFDGSLLPMNGSFTQKFIDGADMNSNQVMYQELTYLETLKGEIDIEPTMYVIWNSDDTTDTYAKYKGKCDEIDDSDLGAGAFAQFDSMGGVNISGVRFKIKAEHLTHAPTYIKISLLKYVKINETENNSELALRWVNDPAVLDIDFTETYKDEYDFDNIVDKEINKHFISTFDSDDICKHVFGIKFAIKSIVPGQNNNNCCIIDSIKVFTSNMLNKYGNAAKVEDVFVRKVDANCRNYYNFDVQEYVWHLPTTTQEWKTVKDALDNSYKTDSDDKPMTDDMYEFLSGTIEKYANGNIDESTSTDTDGYDNFSAYESIYISTDESTNAINEVLSDTYMSDSSIRLTWKYVDYVYIYYSCYTPNARALIQTYFGSTIVNMAIAKLKARVEDINANSSFNGKYKFSGGVAQMKEDKIMSNNNVQIFSWSSTGTTSDKFTNVYESTPIYGTATYLTTTTTNEYKTTKKKKKSTTELTNTDIKLTNSSKEEYLRTLDTSKTTLDSKSTYSNVVENTAYKSVESWTNTFVPVAIKYILEE